MVSTDKNLLPIVKNKYNIQLIIDCRDDIDKISFSELLRLSEPFVNSITIYDPQLLFKKTIENYIQTENSITDYDIEKKILYNPIEINKMDIDFFTQPLILSKDNGRTIQLIHQLLDQIEEEGKYDYNDNKIVVNRLYRKNQYQNIINTNSYKNYMEK
jgi:hypothetical protein